MMTRNDRFFRGIYYATLIMLAAPFVLPFLWMVSTAFKSPSQIFADPPQWIPNPVTLDNFTQAWGLLDFPLLFRNSFIVTGLSVFGTLLTSPLVGYAFATLPGRGKTFWFNLMLATIMIPSAITLIPLFVLFSKLGWVDTYLPLVLPSFFANAVYVFLFRQFFRTIPMDLFESAELDGCNPWQAYWRIALPLARPAVSAVAVFAFIGAWNDFLGPLVYLNTADKYTVSLGLSLFQGVYYTQLEYLMPMSLAALLPVLALFIFSQHYFVEGVLTTRFEG